MNLSLRTGLLLGIVHLFLASACGPSLSAAHVKSAEAATQAYSGGRYREAASHWADAARATTNKYHQDEANYRRASSLLRAGELLPAQKILAVLKSKPGHRQARAAFDHAYLRIEQGEPSEGHALLEKALLAHPESGNAERAMRWLLTDATAAFGLRGGLELLRRLEFTLNDTASEQPLRYFRARLLQDADQAEAALKEYKLLIQRFPYPKGVYWDEASLQAAELLAASRKPVAAAQLLKNMLKERESAAIVGSYERRFSTAHFRLAELYRDQLQDWRRARDEFRKIFNLYEGSLKRDDALWQASLLSYKHGEHTAACADAKRLMQLPNSRFHRCTELLCAAMKNTKRDSAENSCPRYLRAELPNP